MAGRLQMLKTLAIKLCSVNSTSCKKGYNSYWKVSNKSLSMEFVVKFSYLMLHLLICEIFMLNQRYLDVDEFPLHSTPVI